MGGSDPVLRACLRACLRAAEHLSILIDLDPAILRSTGIAARIIQVSIGSEAERDEVVGVVLLISLPLSWW